MGAETPLAAIIGTTWWERNCQANAIGKIYGTDQDSAENRTEF